MSYYTREGDSCKDNLNLLYFTLKALVAEKVPYRLIRYAYELRLMHIEGQGICCFSCVKCGDKEKMTHFDASHGGFLCEDCAKKYRVKYEISPTLVYTVQYIISVPVNQLYNFTLKSESFDELVCVVDRFRREYIDKEFKSLDILSTLV
jgi:DNA repair protein RecO (recombination protein O)